MRTLLPTIAPKSAKAFASGLALALGRSPTLALARTLIPALARTPILALAKTLALALPLLGAPSHAADFDIGLNYGQSRDFWGTVQDIQNKTGNLSEINSVVRQRYGKPDILYSSLDAAYSYPHDHFESDLLGLAVVGTRAEALAGGVISNPISPEIQAYANTTGIFSFGLRSRPRPLASHVDARLLLGLGPEKRLYAQGAEFIDAIPVRSGILFLGGAEILFLDQSNVGEDFWITTEILLRGLYFHSTTDAPKSRPSEDNSFATLRWKLQNEWLKETSTFLSSRTRFGIVSVLGQTPLPYLSLPITWDYQQRLALNPGLKSISGLGGLVRFVNENALPNVSLYGGYFGGALGAGLELQLGSVLFSASTYGVESYLTPARDTTRLWSASMGIAL